MTPTSSDSPHDAHQLLVPIHERLSAAEAERLLETAAAIAHRENAELLVASLTVLVRQTPLEGSTEKKQEAAATLEEYVEIARSFDVPASGTVVITHDEVSSILNQITENECHGVIMAVDPTTNQRRRLLSGDTVESVVARAECEVYVEKQRDEHAPVESILCAVDAGPHSELAAKTARAIALDTGATVEIIHYLSPTADEEEHDESTAILQAAEEILEDVDSVEVEELEAEDPAEAIVTRSERYDYTVLGAPTSGLLQQFVYGTVPDVVNQGSKNGVVMAQADTGSKSLLKRWFTGDPIE